MHMVRITYFLAFISVFVVGITFAEEEGNRTGATQIALHLSDGSRVIGAPSITTLPFRTSFIAMDVPIALIESAQFKDDQESASIYFRNGDKLTGVISLSSFEITTIFGKVSIGLEHVRRLTCAVANELHVEALIDGNTELHVTRRGIYWKTFGVAKPGRHEGRNEPTWVNGKQWFPKWGEPEKDRGNDESDMFPLPFGPLDSFRFELLAVGSTRGATGIEKRDRVTWKRSNGELVIAIPDRQLGPRWYRFRLCMD